MGRTYRLQSFWERHWLEMTFEVWVDLIGGSRRPSAEGPRPPHCTAGSKYQEWDPGFDTHLAWDELEDDSSFLRVNVRAESTDSWSSDDGLGDSSGSSPAVGGFGGAMSMNSAGSSPLASSMESLSSSLQATASGIAEPRPSHTQTVEDGQLGIAIVAGRARELQRRRPRNGRGQATMGPDANYYSLLFSHQAGWAEEPDE